MLAPHLLIFTRVEATLIDPATGSFGAAEPGLVEIDRRGIPLVLLSSRTRAEVEPLRRKLEHGHPFVSERGGGIFLPDGYFNLRIPGAERSGRYLCIPLGRPYSEVCAVLDEIADQCGVGIAGFHHMNAREIAQNLGLRSRESELASAREFDELFFFTSANDQQIRHFVAEANRRNCQVQQAGPFWHFSCGNDEARAVRILAKTYRDATRTRLRTAGVSSATEDCSWLAAVDSALLLPAPRAGAIHPTAVGMAGKAGNRTSGPAGWTQSILQLVG